MAATVRLAVLAALPLVLALALAEPAAAALAFRFDRASARPGTTVTASEPGWRTAPAGVVVYLVPTRLPGVTPDASGSYILARPPARHAVRLGRPRLAAGHRLLVRFRVPAVPAGDYTTAFWCASCSTHGDFFASALWAAKPTRVPSAVLRVVR